MEIRRDKTKAKLGRKSWFFNIPNGKQNGRRVYCETRDQAKKKLDAYLRVNKGVMTRISNAWNFSLWDCYLKYCVHLNNRVENKKNISFREVKKIQSKVDKMLQIMVEDKPLAKWKAHEITTGILKHCVLDVIATWTVDKGIRKGQELSGSSQKEYWSCLEGLFKFAKSLDAVVSNPFTDLPKPSKKPISKNLENASELLNLANLKAVVNCAPGHHKIALVFAMRTGLRNAEQIGLNWENIEWHDDGTMTVHVTHTVKPVDEANGHIIYDRVIGGKTDAATRQVECSGRWLADLKAEYLRQGRPAGDRPVFVNAKNERLFANGAFNKILHRAQNDAAVEHFHWHMLRHAFASYWIKTKTYGSQTDADWAELARVLGHNDDRITKKTYAHFIKSDRDRKAAAAHMAKMDAELDFG